MSTATINAPVGVTTPVIVKLGVFPGMLGRFQVSAYGDLQRVGLPKEVAHLIATDFGGDLGNLMKSDPDVQAKVGKAMKAGESKISLSGSGKVTTTRSMSCVRGAQVILSLKKEAIIETARIEKWSESVQDYIDSKKAQSMSLKFEQ